LEFVCIVNEMGVFDKPVLYENSPLTPLFLE